MMDDRTTDLIQDIPDLDRSKVAHLIEIVARLERVVVAFSGGVDSTLLLAICLRVLGPENVLAATADSPTLPRSELQEARTLAAELGATHIVFPSQELLDERFAANSPDRCYYCKAELFAHLRRLAQERGFSALVYGATAADLGDHRPGMRAAQDMGARAPLLEAGLTKEEVRALSRVLGLRTWNKPAMACLSSRIPYGQAITEGDLRIIEQAEELLRHEMGFRQVRVRHHGPVARIEIEPHNLQRLLDEPLRRHVVEALKALGYTYVTIDLDGFRSGSMNEALSRQSIIASQALEKERDDA